MLPERIPQLDVSIGDQANAGQLLKASTCEFRYLDASVHQPSVALLMPAYLSTGAGIAGVQPKIMVPEARFAVPIPTLIVKAASEAYPGLTANEYLCLRAATLAGIETPTFDFSHDGKLLVLERFDTVMKAASDERIARELLQGMRDSWRA